MQNAKARASKNCRMVISSPKKSDQNQKLQHRTRAGSHVLHRPRHHHPARLTCQREPARLPWWCNRSYRATPTAWIVFAPAPWVSIERGGAGFTNKGYLARFARNPCAARGRAILDLIARVDRRAGARIFALKFCLHGLNHWAPPSMRAHAHS